jgi:lipopolysaccharide biosynthesis regulator YciM
LRTDWQKHVLASSGYLELGMFDDAALVLEETAPEDKTRSEVLGARVDIYLAAEKWDFAAAVANYLVKVQPENTGWWINLAYATRRCEGIETAEAILLLARGLHQTTPCLSLTLRPTPAQRGSSKRQRHDSNAP